MKYTDTFKNRMVQKLAMPQGPSAGELATEVGVPQSTLSRWLREAGRVSGQDVVPLISHTRSPMSAKRPQGRPTEVPPDAQTVTGPLPAKGRWIARRKREVVLRLLRGESIDVVSREIGVEIYRLEQWREQALEGMDANLKSRHNDPVSAELDAARKRLPPLVGPRSEVPSRRSPTRSYSGSFVTTWPLLASVARATGPSTTAYATARASASAGCGCCA